MRYAIIIFFVLPVLTSCMSVQKSMNKTHSTIDSTTKQTIEVREVIKVDSVKVTDKKDSIKTVKTNDYETLTVIEEKRDTLGRVTSKVTTIKNKGHIDELKMQIASAHDSAHVITASNFDATAAAETRLKAEKEDVVKNVTKKGFSFPWWILIIAGVVFILYKKFSKFLI